MSDHRHSPDPLVNHGYTDLCSCGLRIHRDDNFDWVPDDGEMDARIAELGALVAKYKWQRDEAIADGPGYFPRDTLERRWAERTKP